MKKLNIKLSKQHTSTQVEISLDAVITLPLVFSISQLLDIFKKWLFEAGREIIVEFLRQLDDLLFTELQKNGAKLATYKKKTLMTSLGEISFKRRQVKKGGSYWIPLNKFHQMNTKERILDEALEDSLQGCLFTSFRKAREWCEKLCCLGTLWGRFQCWGEDVRLKEKEAVQFFLEGGMPSGNSNYTLALVMIDGIWHRKANKRKKKKKDRKKNKDKNKSNKKNINKKQSKNKRKSSHFELKTARLSFGRIEDGEWKWTQPVVYADR